MLIQHSVIAILVLALACAVEAQNGGRRRRTTTTAAPASPTGGAGGQNQAGDSPFLDRASFVPSVLNVNNLDKFFTKQSTYCDEMRRFGLAQANGSQIRTGVCVSVVIGALPRFEKMSSQIITKPANGGTVDRTKDISIVVKVRNLQTGFFDNPNTGYYIAPQTLNKDGIIEGHTHVSVESLGNGQNPADPTQFQFFKGLNDAGINGVLNTTIPANTLKNNGLFRICTISGAFAHQPVVMPVAQRGAQDDCIRVNVVSSGGGNNLINTRRTTTTRSTSRAVVRTTTTTTTRRTTTTTRRKSHTRHTLA